MCEPGGQASRSAAWLQLVWRPNAFAGFAVEFIKSAFRSHPKSAIAVFREGSYKIITETPGIGIVAANC